MGWVGNKEHSSSSGAKTDLPQPLELLEGANDDGIGGDPLGSSAGSPADSEDGHVVAARCEKCGGLESPCPDGEVADLLGVDVVKALGLELRLGVVDRGLEGFGPKLPIPEHVRELRQPAVAQTSGLACKAFPSMLRSARKCDSLF